MSGEPEIDQGQSVSEVPVEGGAVEKPRPHPFDPREHHARTASKITYVLLTMTAGTVLIHYSSLIVTHFLDRADLAEALSEVFRVWIPLLSGFLGSALAYYFAQRER
jgi:hypothetical protein